MRLKFELVFGCNSVTADPVYMDHTECAHDPHFSVLFKTCFKDEESSKKCTMEKIILSVPDLGRQRVCVVGTSYLLEPGDVIKIHLENVVQSFLAGIGINDIDLPPIQVL